MYKKLTTCLLAMMLGLGILSLAACGSDDSASESGQKKDGVAESMQKQADEQKKKDQAEGKPGGTANSDGGAMEQGADNAQKGNEKASQDMKQSDKMGQ